jgi:LTXXQ motif family protein
MCNDRYAHQAGRLAYLEASLGITDAQRSAFDQWRDSVLSTAKSHSEACLAHMPAPGHFPDAVERNADEQKMLEARLAALRDERPALEALYQSLTAEQKKLFDREGDHFGHHHGHGERFGERPDGNAHHEPG